MYRCSNLLVFREMKVKMKDTIIYLSEWLNLKTVITLNACKGIEKLSHSSIGYGNVNSSSMLENVFWEMRPLATTWVTITLLGIYDNYTSRHYVRKVKTQVHIIPLQICSQQP